MATTDRSNQDCQTVVTVVGENQCGRRDWTAKPAWDPFFGVAGAIAIVPCAIRVFRHGRLARFVWLPRSHFFGRVRRGSLPAFWHSTRAASQMTYCRITLMTA